MLFMFGIAFKFVSMFAYSRLWGGVGKMTLQRYPKKMTKSRGGVNSFFVSWVSKKGCKEKKGKKKKDS